MKKLLILTAIILFGFTNVKAQETNFGAKAGVNFATFTGDGDHNDTRTAIHVGIMAEFMISDMFAFQPELMYSAQGAKYSDAQDGEGTYDGVFKNDYINIPLMAKYYVAEGFSLEAGPQVGFLISSIEEYEEINTGEADDWDVKDKFKGIDFGINIGVAYKLEGGLNFGARYNLGFSDLNDDPEYFGDTNFKNGVIQVSLGYFF